MSLNLWQRIKSGLSKTSTQITQNIKHALGVQVDDRVLDDLEDLLIQGDFGVHVAARLRGDLKKQYYGQSATVEQLKETLSTHIEVLLKGSQAEISLLHAPTVILMIGVNGAGKTTTIAKLTQKFHETGKKIEWVAADTFRSAATEQLLVWAKRLNIHTYTTKNGGDSAGLVFDAIAQATSKQTDILLIDTAGRLHNKDNLMDELAKIKRVMTKINIDLPHHAILVLDATTGQNMSSQLKAFDECIHLSGIIVTKLDGTAKAGGLVHLYETYKKQIYAIGVGETAQDLQTFSPKAYACGIMGLEVTHDTTISGNGSESI